MASTSSFRQYPQTRRASRIMPKPSTSSCNNPEGTMLDFPISWVRQSFPALNASDHFVFFDNGAGAQVPQAVLNAVQDHLLARNVQRGGRYRRSQEFDAAIQRARESVAIFLNAREPDEVAFGMNATSFIRLVSLALGETLGERREIIVTDLDHEANVATWLALQARGAEIRWWKMRPDGTLHHEDLERLLNSRTRLVACAVASNAIGSIVEAKQTARITHASGAEVFLDAVHYARPMERSMCRTWIATTLSVRATRFSLPTWVFCTASGRLLKRCQPSGKILFPTRFH